MKDTHTSNMTVRRLVQSLAWCLTVALAPFPLGSAICLIQDIWTSQALTGTDLILFSLLVMTGTGIRAIGKKIEESAQRDFDARRGRNDGRSHRA